MKKAEGCFIAWSIAAIWGFLFGKETLPNGDVNSMWVALFCYVVSMAFMFYKFYGWGKK